MSRLPRISRERPLESGVVELEAGGWGVEMKEGKTKFRGLLLTGLRAEGFVAGKVLERRRNLPVVTPRRSGRH